MDKAIKDAILSCDYEKAITLGNAKLAENPDDKVAHYILATTLEELERHKEALHHICACLDNGIDIFDYLVIAVRCAQKIEHYEQAYEFAKRALNTKFTPEVPKLIQTFYSVFALIPRIRGAKVFTDMLADDYQSQLEYLQQYVDWYEQQDNPKTR